MLSEWDKIEPYKARGFIAEWPARETRGSIALFGRIEIFFRGQHSRERAQRQIELLGAGGAERQADGVGGMAGAHGEGGRRGQRDVAPGRGGDECLRAPMLAATSARDGRI